MNIDSGHKLKIFLVDNETPHGEILCEDKGNPSRACNTDASGECIVEQSWKNVGWDMIEVERSDERVVKGSSFFGSAYVRAEIAEVPVKYYDTGYGDDFEDWVVIPT